MIAVFDKTETFRANERRRLSQSWHIICGFVRLLSCDPPPDENKPTSVCNLISTCLFHVDNKLQATPLSPLAAVAHQPLAITALNSVKFGFLMFLIIPLFPELFIFMFFFPGRAHVATLSHLLSQSSVLPVLLVPASRDADGWEAVVHEAESHRPSLWAEQLPHDQQVHNSLRRSRVKEISEQKCRRVGDPTRASPRYWPVGDILPSLLPHSTIADSWAFSSSKNQKRIAACQTVHSWVWEV